MEYRYEFTEERGSPRWGWKRLVICILGVILVLVGIFIGGYFRGIEEGKRSKDNHIIYKNEQSFHLTWHEQSCITDKKCPEGFSDHPLLLISLDGFRSDYLERKLTPAIQWLAQCGVQGPMQPVFPSKTFPNHYTIVTGLYPETHGIVDNKIYDPITKERFSVGNRESLKSIWWLKDPLWVTNERENKKSAVYFWPGSEVKINNVRPTYFRTYNGKLPLECQIQTIFSWLDLPSDSRPSFITIHLNEPDTTGHNFGPYSKQMNETLESVDAFISELMTGLHKRDLLGCINVIIVADHGMEDTSCSRILTYDKYLGNLETEFLLYGVTARIRPKNSSEYSIKETVKMMKCKNEHFRVYDKRQLPKRFHYSDNYRIDPIVIDLDPQWLIFKNSHNESGKDLCDGGAHGYDNIEPSMRALFVGHGPDFKSHLVVKPFPNIELYNVMADLINVTAQPNNGTEGSLNHILRNPKPVEKSLLYYPNLCSVTEEDFEEMKRITNCSCEKKFPLDNFEDNNHVPWGLVGTATEGENAFLCLLYNEDYTSTYSYQLRLPVWTAFTLKDSIWSRKKESCWAVDYRILLDYTPKCKDYQALPTEFTQQLLFPAELSSSIRTIPMAWLATNSVPMYVTYGSNVNRFMEEMLLRWTRKYKTINVVTGPAFDVKTNGIKFPNYEILKVQKHSVPIPTHYFYVITRCLDDINIHNCLPQNVDVISFLLPHLPEPENCQSAEEYLLKHSARVKDVEILTGLRFFSSLPVFEEIRLRTFLPSELWDT
ncbi:venom phosphodiesterase-like [Centruroides vittatus]|uniref:venom phosphodiesterase-like n=1 Tax=Centruroides vittatus TaxID=120091 RepID=UPI00350E90D4